MRATSFEEVNSGALLDPGRRFAQAIDIAQDGLVMLHEDGKIAGAMIFGSAVSQDRDSLSDLDMLVVTPDEDAYRSERQLRLLALKIRRETAVAPELGWMTSSDAKGGKHNLLPTTLAWMGRQAIRRPDMVIGQSPTELIEPNDEDVLNVVSAWLRTARNNVMKASQSADAQVAFGLSAPHIAARKSLDVLRYRDPANILDIPPPQSDDLTKTEVGAIATAVYGRHDRQLVEMYEELALIKQGFLGFLEATAIEHIVNRRGYDATLDELAADVVPKASDLLLRMHMRFDEMAEQLTGTHPAYVAPERLLPEPNDPRYTTSHGHPANDVGVYNYGLRSVSSY